MKQPKSIKPIKPAYTVLENPPELGELKNHEHSLLFEMLAWMRPHGSKHEQEFCDKYLATIPGMRQDGFGNYYLAVGDEPRVMFSAHTDTVHHTGGYQNLVYDEVHQVVEAHNSSCLGADDTTGIYIMLRMIEAGVPGLYVFHRGEEVGCLGSTHIAKEGKVGPHTLESLKFAIAFDRKGTTDLITHQSTGKCASDEAASQLTEAFFEYGLGMTANENGIYTDTAHYNGHIRECFNLSVGYYHQHTPSEYQDLAFLDVFVKACIGIDWNKLDPVRDVDDVGDIWGWGKYGLNRPATSLTSQGRLALLSLMQSNPEDLVDFMEEYLGITDDDVDEFEIGWVDRPSIDFDDEDFKW